MGALARSLNESGCSGRLGGTWTVPHIREMLSNEKYLGNALLMKQYRNNHIEKKLVKNCGELPMYYAEGTHEAIIDQDAFSRAQEKLNAIAETTGARHKPTRSAFTGLIVCGQCGGKYKRIKNHRYFAWNCTAYQKEGKDVCPGLQIREDVLYKAAAEAMGTVEFNEERFSDSIVSVHENGDHVLRFCFKDGRDVAIPWKTPSRAESWTPEMKEIARQRTIQQRREK